MSKIVILAKKKTMVMIILGTGESIELSDEDFNLLTMFSVTLRNMAEDVGLEDMEAIPLTNMTPECFNVIMEWCHMHASDLPTNEAGEVQPCPLYTDDEIKNMRVEFSRKAEIKDERDRDLMERVRGPYDAARLDFMQSLTLAVNYLDIQRLMHPLFQTYAGCIKHVLKPFKSSDPEAPKAIRTYFNLPDDCTDAQRAETQEAAQITATKEG